MEIKGVERLLEKLTTKPVHVEAWRQALTKATRLAEAEARRRSPVLTGKLRASVTSRLDGAAMPLFGIVTAPATSRRGTRYGFILDAGRGRRKRHRGWFRGALEATQHQINAILAECARGIENAWQR